MTTQGNGSISIQVQKLQRWSSRIGQAPQLFAHDGVRQNQILHLRIGERLCQTEDAPRPAEFLLDVDRLQASGVLLWGDLHRLGGIARLILLLLHHVEEFLGAHLFQEELAPGLESPFVNGFLSLAPSR